MTTLDLTRKTDFCGQDPGTLTSRFRLFPWYNSVRPVQVHGEPHRQRTYPVKTQEPVSHPYGSTGVYLRRHLPTGRKHTTVETRVLIIDTDFRVNPRLVTLGRSGKTDLTSSCPESGRGGESKDVVLYKLTVFFLHFNL